MARGYKTGGRKRGTPNKATATLRALAADLFAEGISPLEFLTSVYRNAENDLALRVDAAAKAAQYVHPRLAAVTLGGDPEKPVNVLTQINLVPVEPRKME